MQRIATTMLLLLSNKVNKGYITCLVTTKHEENSGSQSSRHVFQFQLFSNKVNKQLLLVGTNIGDTSDAFQS